MKWIIFVLISINTHLLFAQVSLKIVKEATNTTYFYPNNSQFTISDNTGKEVIFGTGNVITFDGDYILKIKSNGNKKADIITSDRGRLLLSYEKPATLNHDPITNTKDLRKLETILRPSQKYKNTYTGAIAFSNGLHVVFEDTKSSARLNGTEIPIANDYIVELPEGNLQLKFDVLSGELDFRLNSLN